jgi:hypothetical protein
MANYLLAYKGGQMAQTPEAREKAMAAWGAWFGALGDALVDGGNPCGASKLVASNGSVSDGAPSLITGYSVIRADTLAKATAMTKGCPLFATGGSIEVYETINVM